MPPPDWTAFLEPAPAPVTPAANPWLGYVEPAPAPTPPEDAPPTRLPGMLWDPVQSYDLPSNESIGIDGSMTPAAAPALEQLAAGSAAATGRLARGLAGAGNALPDFTAQTANDRAAAVEDATKAAYDEAIAGGADWRAALLAADPAYRHAVAANPAVPGGDRLVTDATLKDVSDEAAARAAGAVQAGGLSPKIEMAQELVPWLLGPAGAAVGAADAGGNRRADVLERGGSETAANLAGVADAAGAVAVPHLVHGLWGPAFEGVGDAVASRLGAPAGRIAEATVAGGATGAGLAAEGAGISAATGDTERAKAELASIPSQAATLALLGGGHAGIGEAVRALSEPAAAPDAAPAAQAPTPAASPATSDELFAKVWSTLSPQTREAVVRAVEANANEAGTARVEAVKQEADRSTNALPTNGAAPTEPAVPAPNTEIPRGQEEVQAPPDAPSLLNADTPAAAPAAAAGDVAPPARVPLEPGVPLGDIGALRARATAAARGELAAPRPAADEETRTNAPAVRRAQQETADVRGGAGGEARAAAAAASDHGEPRPASAPAPSPRPGEPAVVEPRGAAVEPVRGPAAGDVPAERAPAAPTANPPRVKPTTRLERDSLAIRNSGLHRMGDAIGFLAKRGPERLTPALEHALAHATPAEADGIRNYIAVVAKKLGEPVPKTAADAAMMIADRFVDAGPEAQPKLRTKHQQVDVATRARADVTLRGGDQTQAERIPGDRQETADVGGAGRAGADRAPAVAPRDSAPAEPRPATADQPASAASAVGPVLEPRGMPPREGADLHPVAPPNGAEQAQGDRIPGEHAQAAAEHTPTAGERTPPAAEPAQPGRERAQHDSSTAESNSNKTGREVTPRVDESATAAQEDVHAGDERAAMERSGRMPIAPLPAAEGGAAAPRAVKPLREIVRGLSDWLGAQTYARRKLQRGAAGYYAPASGGIVLKRAHDLDVAAHEIGHWLDDRFGIMADHLSLEARTSAGPEEEAAAAQREAVASAFDHELRHFWPYGSEPPARLNAGEARNYQRAEGVAEWLRAWMVNPESAEKAAPLFSAKFEALVPETVRERLREFGDDVRGFHHAPALEAGGANIRQLGDLGQPTMAQRLAQAWANRRTRDQVAQPLRFGLRDAAAVRFTDQLAPVYKAIRWAGAQRGEAGDAAATRAETLIRLLAGRDDKATGIARVGMIRAEWLKDGKIQLADGVGGGIDWLGGWVDSRSEETIRRDLHALDSYMVAQKTIETADQIDAERAATINATLAGLKERYKDDPETLVRKISQLGRWAARLEARDRARKARLSGQGGGTRPDDEQARRIVGEVANDPVLRARLDEGAKRYRAWADGSLRYLVDKGRMSQDSYDEIKAKNQQYVAMHRVMEDLGHPGVSGGGKIGSVKDVVKRRQGSQREIDNPLANLVDNSMRAVFEADRNEAVRSFVDLLRDARRMHQGDAPDLAAIGQKVDSAGEGVLTVFRNGEAEHWKLAPELHEAVQGIASAPRLSGLLTLPGKLLHAGVVNNPAFAVRNVIRDYLSRLVISQATPQGVLAKLRNLRQQTPLIGRHFDDVEKAMVELAGGAFSGHYMRSKVDWNRSSEKRILELRKDKSTIVTGLKTLGSAYMHAIHSSEFAGRAREFHAVFDQMRSRGVDEQSAALMAAKASRDLIDFAESGRWMREVNQLVPFTNAALQGLRSTGKALVRNPAGVLTRWALSAVLPSAAVWALHVLNGHDDEYRNLPAWRRDLFWNIRVGADTWVSIPKPFELGIGAAGVERGLDAALLHSRGMDADKAIARAYDGWAGSMAKGLMPIDAKALLGPYGSIGELLLNKNLFTGQKIVPDYESQLPIEQRTGTAHASRIGQLAQLVTGDSVDARQVDHLIRGFFGGLGGLAETTSDLGRADRDSGTHLLQQVTGVLRSGEGEHQVDVTNFLASEAAAGRPQGKAARQVGEFNKAYWQAASGDDREAIAAAMRDYATGRDPLQAFDTAVGAADQFESALKKLPPAARPGFLIANRDAVLRAHALVKANEVIDKAKKRGLSPAQVRQVAQRLMEGINGRYPDVAKASR